MMDGTNAAHASLLADHDETVLNGSLVEEASEQDGVEQLCQPAANASCHRHVTWERSQECVKGKRLVRRRCNGCRKSPYTRQGRRAGSNAQAQISTHPQR